MSEGGRAVRTIWRLTAQLKRIAEPAGECAGRHTWGSRLAAGTPCLI